MKSMSNRAIAEKFYELADLLDIQGEANPFRVTGLRRAARAIESLAEPVVELLGREDITKIQGIGKGSVKKIKELVEQGKLSETEELLEKLPVGLLDMLKIPEVGPKTVHQLWKQLRINTVAQLEEMAASGKLQILKGFGAKTEENILRGIKLFREGQQRTHLGFAYPLAQEVVQALAEVKEVKKVAIAGSLRRMKETIGDIDILVAAKQPEPIMEKFVHLPMVSEILAKGDTKSSIRTDLNIQVDLRVVPNESFGAAWQYFTGSKDHNVALRSLAKKKGWKISEYGLFSKTGQRLAGRAEKDIYHRLGLSFIPPELRENRGELAAAQAKKLPELVDLNDLKGDFHIHTDATDGRCSMEEMVAAAHKLGLTQIAITDHSQAVRVAHGLDEQRVIEQGKKVAALRKEWDKRGLTILHGIELDILADGSLDLDSEVVRQLDFCIGSIHSRFRQSKKAMTERLLRAIRSGLIDCLGHPTGRMIPMREPYDFDFEKIVHAAVAKDVAFEINSSYERLDLNDLLARKAGAMGARFLINSDAHHTRHFQNIRYGVATARRGWLSKEQVLNTLSKDAFLEWLRKRKGKPNK